MIHHTMLILGHLSLRDLMTLFCDESEVVFSRSHDQETDVSLVRRFFFFTVNVFVFQYSTILVILYLKI